MAQIFAKLHWAFVALGSGCSPGWRARVRERVLRRSRPWKTFTVFGFDSQTRLLNGNSLKAEKETDRFPFVEKGFGRS